MGRRGLDSPALLIHPTPGRKTVTAGVWLASGSAHERRPLAGATHLVEHLTLRRCGGRDRFELARLVDRLGGDIDAWTSTELMGVTVQTTVDAVGEGLELLVDAILEPSFDDDDVELERRISLAELELLRDDPAERVEEELLHAAWGDHPLARPVIGTAGSLASLTSRALRRHHASMVRPGRVLAAVTGDVDAAEIAALLQRLPLGEGVEPAALPPVRWLGRHRVVRRQAADQAHARLAFPAMDAASPDSTALGVLNRILGVGASSRLFQRLREREGLTYDIWSSPMLRRAGGLLEVGWACAPAVLGDVWVLVSEELRRVAVDLVDDEVEVAKEGLFRGLVMDVEQPASYCAMDVAEVLDRGRRFDPEVAREEIEAVEPGQVRRMAAELLRPERMATALCGPDGASVQVA
jgi:predicted Zn-dependent peptidase